MTTIPTPEQFPLDHSLIYKAIWATGNSQSSNDTRYAAAEVQVQLVLCADDMARAMTSETSRIYRMTALTEALAKFEATL